MSSIKYARRRGFHVALIQMNPKSLDPEQNFNTAATHIRAAASQGASLAVLPEYHLTGWQPEDAEFRTIAARAHEYLDRYCRLARELSINIVPGTLVMLSSPRERQQHGKAESDCALLNKAFFISSSGDILGQYTKANLWHPERAHLKSGPHFTGLCGNRSESLPHTVIQTPIGIVGLLICYDLAFPEAFRTLVRAGAEVIIIPTFTKSDDMSAEARAFNPYGEDLFVRTALTCRAFENTCCVIFCNVGGPTSDGFMGLSQVALPIIGTADGSFTDAMEGMRVVDVDLTLLDVAEENYKIREDLAQPGFHYT